MSDHRRIAGGGGRTICSCGQLVPETDWTLHAKNSDLENALVDAIDEWMRAATEHIDYHHGKAQGIAHALAALRGTSFTTEWETGLDGYQNRIVIGPM